ncbi:hypothetical protein ES707_07683 [subsurface metagenome]
MSRPYAGNKTTPLPHIISQILRIKCNRRIEVTEEYNQTTIHNGINPLPGSQKTTNFLHKPDIGKELSNGCREHHYSYRKYDCNYSRLVYLKRKECGLSSIHLASNNSFGILYGNLPLSLLYPDYTGSNSKYQCCQKQDSKEGHLFTLE